MKPTRSNSAAAAVQAIIKAASKPLEPPAHCKLSPAARKFWPGIIASRSPDEWTEADLVIAAHLARVQCDIESETAALHAEGSVLGDKVNPRATVVDQLAKRQMAMFRTLRMGGRIAGDIRDEAGRRQTARKARKVLEIGGDGLLA